MADKEMKNLNLGLMIAVAITAIQAWRVSAISYLMKVGDSVPVIWSIPFKGDSFIGITALIVAFLLARRRGLNIWMIGIIWQVIGLVDLYVAMETQLLAPLGQAPYLVVPAGIAMHFTALYLLIKNQRFYFTVQSN